MSEGLSARSIANLPCDGKIVICKDDRCGCGCWFRCCCGRWWYCCASSSCTRALYSSFVNHTDASRGAVFAIRAALCTIWVASYAFAAIRAWIASTSSTTADPAYFDTIFTVLAAVCPNRTAFRDGTRWTAAISIGAAP
jgi:hypothetical protein